MRRGPGGEVCLAAAAARGSRGRAVDAQAGGGELLVAAGEARAFGGAALRGGPVAALVGDRPLGALDAADPVGRLQAGVAVDTPARGLALVVEAGTGGAGHAASPNNAPCRGLSSIATTPQRRGSRVGQTNHEYSAASVLPSPVKLGRFGSW